ncbi:MAG: EF hand [Candidatus Nitrotoga sp. SPKER]|nr:MAG: EF hand [Candidatus Nitrotoga sp. SPKER]
MKKTFISLVITSCFVLSPAIAQADSSKGKMQEDMFKAMDTNSDGMITKEESKNFGEKAFQKMDANGDGQLSSEEMKAAYKKMRSGESNKMSNRNMDSNQTRSKKDDGNPKSETKVTDSSDNSCCWSPNSSANKSSNKMSGSQGKKMNDTQNNKMEDENDDDD